MNKPLKLVESSYRNDFTVEEMTDHVPGVITKGTARIAPIDLPD
ncbi:hypothetical protein [Paenibacillus sophorae]|nr:hypothetical protein [Paenibacillus sophorae]